MKLYLKGFLKGSGLLLLLTVFMTTINYFNIPLLLGYGVVTIIVLYLINIKSKEHKTNKPLWIVLGLLLGGFILPFFYASIQKNK